jgi:hypothetical protein
VEEVRAREAVMRLHKEFFEKTVSENPTVENDPADANEVELRATLSR